MSSKPRDLILVLICFLSGLAAHGYAWFNQFYSHDSMETRFGRESDEFVAGLGRFLHPVIHKFRGTYSTPALIGFLSLAFLIAACILLIRMFRIRNLLWQCVLSVLLITYGTLTLTYATYMHDADLYMLAFLCSVLAVYLMRRGGRLMLLSPVLIFMTCGLYQSYLFTAFGVILFLAMKDLSEGISSSQVIKEGAKELLLCAAGLVLYAIGLLISARIGFAPLEGHSNSVSHLASLLSANLFKTLGETYRFWFAQMILPRAFHAHFTGYLNLFLFAAAAILLSSSVVRKKMKSGAVIFLLILTALIPLVLNGIYVLTSGVVHDLMTYQFALVYVFIVYLFDRESGVPENADASISRPKRLAVFVAVLVCCTVAWNSVVYSNNVYLKKDLEYKKTAAVMNRIMDRIEQTPGYEPGKTPVAIIGLLMHSDYFRNRYPDLPYSATGIAYGSSVTYYETYSWYLNNQLGYGINILPLAESEKIGTDDAVRAMSSFPADGCTKISNGVLIVKVSDKWWNQPI